MRSTALVLLTTTVAHGALPPVPVNPTYIHCNQFTDFEIHQGGEHWTPKLCNMEGAIEISTCGHSGSLLDTRIYEGPCINDDHGGECQSALDRQLLLHNMPNPTAHNVYRFHSFCQGHISYADWDADGCITISVGGYYHEQFNFGTTGTATLHVTCHTNAPTSLSPTTFAPVTEAPVTNAPTTEAPTTEAPTTQAPAPTTEPTTKAPRNGMGGDPFTSYKGKTSQFWAPTGEPVDLMQCGPWSLRASVFNTGNGNQWFKDFSVMRNQQVLANISISPAVQDLTEEDLSNPSAGKQSTVLIQTAEWTMTEVGIGKSLQGGATSMIATGANLRGVGGGKHELRAIVTPNGKHKGFHAAMISCDDEVGGNGLAFEISCAPALKLGSLHERLRHAHLDLDFLPSFNAEKTAWGPCTGVLPEVWGTQPLSERTAKMLVPPKATSVDEAQSDE